MLAFAYEKKNFVFSRLTYFVFVEILKTQFYRVLLH